MTDLKSRIKHFHISFFSIILGLTGFTIALEKVLDLIKFEQFDSSIIVTVSLFFTLSVFIIISILYLAKIVMFPDEVKKEFADPIKINFFPAFSISLLLLSVAFLSFNIAASYYLWIAGTVLHGIFTLKVISTWMHGKQFEIKHLNPAWFIPAVGNIIVPIAGIQHANIEILWAFFAIGLIFWLILLVVFFNRIIFYNPLPQKLLPTLFILIAPPAVGSIAITKLSGELTDLSRILYYFAVFILALLLFQIKLFSKIKFYLSWWAYTFPISTMAIASVLMFHNTNLDVFKYFSYGLLAALVLILSVLFVETIKAVIKKDLCIAE